MKNNTASASLALAALLCAPAIGHSQEAPKTNWSSQCVAADLQSPLSCSMEQRVVLRESGAKEDRKGAFLIQLPLGLSIRTGVRLKVDDREPLAVDIQTCEAGGCYAGGPMTDGLVESLRGGKMMTLLFNDLQKKEIGIQIDLAGFSAVYDKIR
jgi:invasion protein IalB